MDKATPCRVNTDKANFKRWSVFDSTEPLRRVQMPVMTLKHRKATVVLSQTQYPAPGMFVHAEHHLLHHRLDTAPFGCMAHRVGLTADLGQIEVVLPNALTFAGAMNHPRGVLAAAVLWVAMDRHPARVPLDDEGNLARQALAQGGTRRNSVQAQGTNEKVVTAKVLDRIKVALAQAQQAQVRFEDVAIDNARAHRKSRISQSVDIDGLEILANKCQTGVGTEVIGQLFDNEFGHVRVHLQDERHFILKSLICKDEFDFLTAKSRIQVDSSIGRY